MQKELVFTVLGADQPGIVEALASAVAENEGNWMESSMSRLGGQFAGIVKIHASSDAISGIESKLLELEASHSLSINIFTNDILQESRGQRSTISIVGHDQKGIVHKVSAQLAGLHINVEELETKVEPASMDGRPMFSANAIVILPDGVSMEQVTNALEDIATDIMVDIQVDQVS